MTAQNQPSSQQVVFVAPDDIEYKPRRRRRYFNRGRGRGRSQNGQYFQEDQQVQTLSLYILKINCYCLLHSNV